MLSKCVIAAAALALAVAFAPTVSFAQAKKEAKAAKPAAGMCTGECNSYKWCHQHWRSGVTGAQYPTLTFCKEGSCPAKC